MEKITLIIALSFGAALTAAITLIKKKKITAPSVAFVLLLSFCAVILSSILQGLVRRHIFEAFFKNTGVTFHILFFSFVQAALIEEVTKVFFFGIFFKYIFLKKLSAPCSSYSGNTNIRKIIPAAFTFGAIFASFETVIYGMLNPEIIIPRNFTSFILHSLLSAYYVEMYSADSRLKIAFIIKPVFLHGLYNMFLFIGRKFSFFIFPVIGLIVLHFVSVLKDSSSDKKC